MKSITGRFIVLIILVLLTVVPARQSSAQFDCITSGGGGGDPTPTPTPECYTQSGTFVNYYCDYVQGFCCEDTYLVVSTYCFGQLVGSETTLIDHYCIEI